MWIGVTLGYPASNAIQAQTFGKYLVDGVAPLYAIGDPYKWALERVLGILLICKFLFAYFHLLVNFSHIFTGKF